MPTPPNDHATILVVDDEPDIRDLLQYNLERDGFGVLLAKDGVDALDIAITEQPDLVILDVMMPRLDGIEVCRRIRRDASLRTTPIIMLTARSEESDHVRGLDVGADSYLTKPISIPILLSQVRALIRQTNRVTEPPNIVTLHDLEIDRDRFVVYQTGGDERRSIKLPRKEFGLLYHLASHPGKVFSRQELLDQVWGPDVYVVDRTVDVHVRKIREKIGSEYIETIKGVGYKFKE